MLRTGLLASAISGLPPGMAKRPMTGVVLAPKTVNQRRYLEAAKRYLGRRDAQTDMVLKEWERTLDDLESDPLSTADRLDWSVHASR